MIERVILRTSLSGKKLFSRGKVRDIWEIPKVPGYDATDLLLMVTTDRISAFDVVMKQGAPDLGKIRNQISLYWFKHFKERFPNHIFSADQKVCTSVVNRWDKAKNDLNGRSLLMRKAKVLPVECVVRGYLAGSGWKDYQEKDRMICGIKLPSGLKESEELSKPIFTPATKNSKGHDENITFDKMVEIVGGPTAEILRDTSLKIYEKAKTLARICGIIIADTKFEFGAYNGKIILIDELLTPDSSRFWDPASYQPGKSQPSFDKQPLRDWLKESGWDKTPPPPRLSQEVIEGMRKRYVIAYERLIGKLWTAS